MNPHQPSREQIEARVTALLLGELPADEAALLRYTIAQDSALQQLHDELQATLVLVREAAKDPADAPVEKAPQLRLSAERRQKLLEHFKTERTKTTAKPEPLSGTKTTAKAEPLFWLKPIKMPTRTVLTMSALVILFAAILAAISLPNFVKARATSQANSVINNLRQIDAAKNEWALENRKSVNDVPTPNDLSPYLKNGIPKPVMGETYALGKVSEPVVADVGGGQRMDSSGASLTVTGAGTSRGQYGAHGVPESISDLAGRIWAADKESYGAMPASPATVPTDTFTVMANSASAPQVVMLAPEPKLAPTPVAAPPVQIVLPQAESAPEVAAQTVGAPGTAPARFESLAQTPEIAAAAGAPAEAGNSYIYSQSIVGYVNVPAPADSISVPATPPPVVAPPNAELPAGTLALNDSDGAKNVDKLAWSEPKEKQWLVPGQATEPSGSTGGKNTDNFQNSGAVVGVVNAFSGSGGFRGGNNANSAGGGGGGFGGAAGTASLRYLGEAQRQPGVSGAAAEDRAKERSLMEAEREREPKDFKRGGNYNGSFALGTANNDSLAWDNSGANRAGTQNQPGTPLAATASATPQLTPPPAPAAAPLGQFPSAAPSNAAGEIAKAKSEAEFTSQSQSSAFLNPRISGVADSRYYRSLAPEAEQKKVPVLGDVPIAGNLFQSSAGASSTASPVAAGTLAQDGKVLYETGKYKEAEAKLSEANKLNPNNTTASHYLNLIEQDKSRRNSIQHDTDTQKRMERVEKDWIVPKNTAAFAFDTVNVKPANKPASGKMAFTGENTYAGGTSVSGGTVTVNTMPAGGADAGTLGVNSDSFKNGIANEDNPAWAGALNKPVPNPSSGPNNRFVSRYAATAPISAALDQLETTNSVVINGGNNTFSPGVSAIEIIDKRDALDRYAKLTGRTLLNGALPSGGEIILPKSLSKESEKQALEAALALNGVSLVNMGGKFVKAVPSTDAGGAGGEIDRSAGPAPTLDAQQLQTINSQNNPSETRAQDNTALNAADTEAVMRQANTIGLRQTYDAAKRDLDQKLALHKLLASKLQAEKLDLSLPEKSMVQITDPAQPGHSQNTWQRLTGQVESKARIKVENDVTDIPGMNGSPQIASFDPYFIQTTFEIMQSEAVLSKVVDALNLQSAWADKNGGVSLKKSQAVELLKQRLDLRPVKNTKLVEIAAKSNDPKEAADIANAVAKAYAEYRAESRGQLANTGLKTLEAQYAQQENDIRLAQAEVERLSPKSTPETTPAQTDVPLRKPAPNAPLPQPEILTSSNAFSTFSLNVSDVSFKFAAASLQNGKLPDTAAIRSEEFINAFDYRDPEAAEGQPMAFTSERARYPFAHNRELLRFAVKTAAAGRQAGRALNLVLLLDNSGSMERADRVAIIREALRVLATQLQPQDTVSVVTFARTARLWADGISGDKAGATLDQIGGITPEGGTNLEEAMRLAYQTARRHYLAGGMNRVVLLTDGAANLGNVEPAALKRTVEAQRKQGIALDCFGIGWEDYNDDLLEQLASNGDGRYAFLNSPEDASKDFAAKLAGALQIAAADVKVQVEFNPARVIAYRQIGYATHQLTKEQFRDNTVAAGQIAAQEAGNALYTIETNPNGDGPIATVHVRYKVPGTEDYREHSWGVAYTGSAPALEQTSPAMRLAATASAFSEWLAASPYAQEVTLDELLRDLSGVPEIYGADDRPKQLETMIREAKSLEGK